MSDLIRGMEMPQGNSTINVLIYADGTVYTGHVNDSRYSAVSVPTPYGRLVDADALMTEVMDSDLDHLQRDDWKEVIQIVADAPTIIEAEVEDVTSHIRQLAGQAGKILVDAALNAIKESEGSERQ